MSKPPNSKLPHVTWLRAFDAAARHSSFSAAADELNLTPAAVSMQIKLLEQHLGAALFRRLARGVALTDLGHAYAQPVGKAFGEMQDATRGLFSSTGRRRVNVQASISYAALVLAPLLPVFQKAFPDIDIRLTTAVWTERFEDGAVDVEIRYGLGDWPERDIRHLGHRSAQIVCNPVFAASLGERLSFAALAEQAVQIIGSERDWDLMAEHMGLDGLPVLGQAKVDSSLIALQMLVGGPGATIVSDEFARHYLEQGMLVSPLGERLPLTRSFFLIVHDDPLKRHEIGQFCDWLLGQHRG